MPVIVFEDGKHVQVGYSKASQAYAIMHGTNKEPATPEQEAFVAKIKDIEFESSQKQKAQPEPTDEARAERRKKLDEIKNDYTLKGKAKFDAIRKVLEAR